jgi:hypothetical protein
MRSGLFGIGLLLLTLPAAAQTQGGTPTRVRGTVDRLEGQTLVVRNPAGQMISIAMPSNVTVSGVVRRGLADIKAGDLIASTSMRQPDGSLRAIELHYLPPGANEGQLPWDLAPDSIMTNATVAGVAQAPQGRMLKVTYKGQQADITVPPDIPVVAFAPGNISLVKPGAAVVIFGQKQADGSVTASRAILETDGVKPPM